MGQTVQTAAPKRVGRRAKKDCVDRRHAQYANAIRKCNAKHGYHACMSTVAVDRTATVVGDVADRIVSLAKVITDAYGRQIVQAKALLAAAELEMPPAIAKECTQFCERRVNALLHEQWTSC